MSTRLLALVGLVVGTGGTALAGGEDFAVWNKAIFVIPIEDQWDFGFEQKLGFEDEARRLDHQQQDYCITYKHPNGWLKLSAALKVKHSMSDDREDWDREVRPHFNVGIASTLYGLDIYNRSRLAYRCLEDDDDYWRFRHKLRLDSPVTFTPLQIKPYVAEEIFYCFNGEGLNANRIQTGLYIPLGETIRLDLFHFWHHSEEDNGAWSQDRVLGTYLRFKF